MTVDPATKTGPESSQSVYLRFLLPVYLPSLFLVLVNSACLILLPIYLLQQGSNITLAALVLTMRGVGILLADGPAGVLANRYGVRPLMLTGGLCASAAMLILVAFDQIAFVLLSACLLGISNGLSLVGRLSYLTDLCAPNERGRAITLMGGIQRFGTLISPLAFSYLAIVIGFQAVFVMMAILALGNVALILGFVEPLVFQERKAIRVSGIFRIIPDFRHILLTAGIAGFLLTFLRSGRQTVFPLAGTALGLDLVQISWIFSISMAIDTLLSYPAGAIMDRFGRKWAAVPGMVILSLSVLVLGLFPGLAAFWLFALLSGLGNGITSGILLVLASDIAPEAQRNQFIGVWRMQTDLGVVTAPYLVGSLIESASLALSAVCLAAAGLLGAGVLAFSVKETLQKDTTGAIQTR